MNLASKLQFELQFSLGGFQKTIFLREFIAEVGDPQVGSDSGEKLLDIVGALRLLDVVVSTRVEPADLVLRLTQSREQKHRDGPQIFVGLEGAAEPRAVEIGHFEVGKDQVGTRRFARFGETVVTIDGRLDLIPLVPKKG